MLAYHPEEPVNRVLNIIDREGLGPVRGIEHSVLQYRWQLMELPLASLRPAVQALLREGLLHEAGPLLRLTASGYARLIAPNILPASTEEPLSNSGTRATEYVLRNQVLAIFRTGGLKAGDRMGADALARHWQVAHFRASDLRRGLDLLLRDGHVRVGRFRKTLFRLEEDGYRYLSGRPAPAWLAAQAPRLELGLLHRRSVPDRLLCMLAAQQFLLKPSQETTRSFEEVDYLLERYELPRPIRFYAYELLHRLGHAEASRGPSMQLTSEGRALLRAADMEYVQWHVKQALRAMVAS